MSNNLLINQFIHFMLTADNAAVTNHKKTIKGSITIITTIKFKLCNKC